MRSIIHVPKFKVKVQVLIGRCDGGMPKKFLERLLVHTTPEKMRCEAVTEDMRVKTLF